MAQDVDAGLLTIGQRLRSAREGLGWSLGDLAQATHIRECYLERLEAGEAGALPAEVFIKGFLRICGDAVGLDGPALVEEWKRGRRDPSEGKPHRVPRPRRPRRGRSIRRAVLLPWAVLVAVVALVVGLILSLTGGLGL